MVLMLFFAGPFVHAQTMHSDNGDGTYTNPVIAADFPDPDVIRVDSVYYMVSTTMFTFPGVPILKSRDLVNWEFACNAVPRFDHGPCYDLQGCNRYGHGQWATSLKYHNGKFYLLFITLDEGGFLCTADRPEGPWQTRKLPKGFYDPGLFFDEDGKIYVAHGYNDIRITELNTDFAPVSGDSLVYRGDIRGGLEGTHVYRINGYYYLYCTYGGLDGFQVALRSRSIYGPYEQHVVIRDTTHGFNYGIHQGALIQTVTGEWWTMLFVDNGPFGRFPSLQPVTWTDGWPMVGVRGKAVVTHRKPDVGGTFPRLVLPTSDEFSSNVLGMQWSWNHNPDPGCWSLTERPGYLRLRTASVTDSLPKARNTLTQRMFAPYVDSLVTVGTVKADVGHLQEGDIGGLAVFQDPYGFIACRRSGGVTSIVMVNNGKVIDSVVITAPVVFFRAHAFHGSGAAPLYGGKTVPFSGIAAFSYSLDGITFKPLGNAVAMRFNLRLFTGNKFCVFAYAGIGKGGFMDVDWFRTSMVPCDPVAQGLTSK